MAEQWREDAWAREAKRPLTIRLGKKLRPKIDRIAAASSLIPDAPVLDQSALDWTAHVAAQWRTIRAEMEEIRSRDGAIPALADISPDHSGIARGGDWKSFFLYGYGEKVAANCAARRRRARCCRASPTSTPPSSRSSRRGPIFRSTAA